MELVPVMKICGLSLVSLLSSCKKRDEQRRRTLPTGLGDAGDESVKRQFAEGNTGEFKAAKESAAASGDQATVDETHGTGIAGKLAEAHVVFLCFKLCAKFRPLRNSSAFAFISFEP